MKKTVLDYYKGEGDHFRISASGISRFFTGTSSWFRENLTDLDEGFTGNTASVLGTIVHYNLECYVKNEPIDFLEIDQYLVNQSTIIDDLDVDYIHHQYPIMVRSAQQWITANVPLDEAVAEKFMEHMLLSGITVGGSCDLHTSNTVYDYKTTSAKTLPKNIQYAHKLQGLTYAKLLIEQGYNIKYISIVYVTTDIIGGLSEKTGKPLKNYPSEAVQLIEPITQEDLDMIDNIHTLIAESVEKFRDEPSMRHLLGQDLRLKGCKTTLKQPIEEEI